VRTEEEIARETSELRARVGREVAERLAHAGIQQVQGANLTLWFAEAFLGPSDCAFLIGQIERLRQPSQLLADRPDADFRTSDSGNLDRWHPRVRSIDQRVCALMGLDERHGETLQGQRYAAGQYFRTHQDFFHTDQSYWPAQAATGGQRTWTAMIYLDQPDAGGETAFDSAGLTVPPRPGMLLMWNNMDANGAPNLWSAHQGAPVQAGVKHIVTKWFREGFWV
jgi:prolyl 4-hydroxylase